MVRQMPVRTHTSSMPESSGPTPTSVEGWPSQDLMRLAVTLKTVTGTAAKTGTLVDPTAVRTVQYTARKRRGHFGISIESVSSGPPAASL